jgi:hypothetical protein
VGQTPHEMSVKGGGCARIGEQVSCLEDGLHVGSDEPKQGGSLGGGQSIWLDRRVIFHGDVDGNARCRKGRNRGVGRSAASLKRN